MKIDYDVYALDKEEVKNVLIVSYVLSVLVLFVFYNSFLVMLLGIVPAILAIQIYKNYRIRKRKELLLEQFRDLLYSFSSLFASGRHMAEAISEAKSNLLILYDKDSPMVKELELMEKEIESSNASAESMFIDLGKRSGLRDISIFGEIYSISLSTGVDIVKVIGITSQILIDKITIVRDIKSYTAQKRFEGRVIGVMPVFLIGFMKLIAPEYLMPLYETMAGRLLMSLALVLTISGFVMADKLTNIEVWNEKSIKGLSEQKKDGEDKEGKSGKCFRRITGFHKYARSFTEFRSRTDKRSRKNSGRGTRRLFLRRVKENKRQDEKS